MNRRGFFARASAIVGVIAASCSPKLIGLAQAQEPAKWQDTPGLSEYDSWNDTVGLRGMKVETLHHFRPGLAEEWGRRYRAEALVRQLQHQARKDALRILRDHDRAR